jgi:hypothetical protein
MACAGFANAKQATVVIIPNFVCINFDFIYIFIFKNYLCSIIDFMNTF